MKTVNKLKRRSIGVEAKHKKGFQVNVIDIKNQTVFFKQDFKVIDDRIMDSNGRVTISPKWLPGRVRSFKIYRNGDGDLLLRPEVSIPAREAWVFQNPKILAGLKKSIQDAKEGKGKIVDDVDVHIKSL